MDLMQMDLTRFKTKTSHQMQTPSEATVAVPLQKEKPTPPTNTEKVKIEKKEFTGELKELTEWFLSNFNLLPTKPFKINNVTYGTPQKWYDYLAQNIEEGPKGARCLFGALENNLLALKVFLKINNRI